MPCQWEGRNFDPPQLPHVSTFSVRVHGQSDTVKMVILIFCTFISSFCSPDCLYCADSWWIALLIYLAAIVKIVLNERMKASVFYVNILITQPKPRHSYVKFVRQYGSKCYFVYCIACECFAQVHSCLSAVLLLLFLVSVS